MNRSHIGILIAIVAVLSVAIGALLYEPRKVTGTPPTKVAQSKDPAQNVSEAHSRRQASASATPAPKQGARPEPSRAPLTGLATKIRDCLLSGKPNWREEYNRLLATMRPEDAPAILEALRELRGQGGGLPIRDLASAVWNRWGEMDPGGALDFLSSRPNRARDENAFQILQKWTGKDSAAAQAWLSAHTDSPFYNAAVMGFINAYASSDPRAATLFATSSLPSGSRLLTDALSQISEKVYRQGRMEGLRQWFGQLPNDARLRQSIVNNVASTLLPRDVQSAANWLTSAAKAGWKSDEAIGDVASRYASFSPEAAMGFVSNLPADSRGYYPGTNRVVRQWMEQNPDGLTEWLNKNQSSPTYQSVAYEYSRALARTDPAAAALWANRITNPNLRALAMQALHP